jgi:outer membrane protein assembly factor BamD
MRRKAIMHPKTVHWMTVALLLGLGVTGCAKKPPVSFADLTDQQVFQRGLQAMEKKRWSEAREAFRYLTRMFLQSPYREKAYLYIADTYFREGVEALPMAVSAYQEFLRLYPNSVDVPYAMFQVGMSYFLQAEKPQRTQENTRKAVEAFQQLLDRYPTGEWAEKARQYLRMAQQRLAEHEFIIGKYYYKKKNYEAALNRFQTMFAQFPPELCNPEAYLLTYRILQKMGRYEESLQYLRQVVQLFPGTAWSREAATLLNHVTKNTDRP